MSDAMHDDKNPSENPVQNPLPIPQSPDGNGTGTDQPADSLGARIQQASHAAVEQHTAQTVKRGRGRPRKYPLPVGQVDTGPRPASFPPDEAAPLPVDFEEPQPSFDEQGAAALLDGALDALNDFMAAFQRNAAMRWMNDAGLAEQAANQAKMSPEVRNQVRVGAMACLKKYAVDLSYAPEATLALGLGLWGIGNYSAYKRLEIEGKRMRGIVPPAK